LSAFPSLPLFTDAWVADTKHLTRLERGTYHDLLVLMWRSPNCRVPNDDAWLGKRLGMTPDEVKSELRPIIAEFIQSDGNWLMQKRLQKEFAWVSKNSKKRSDAAKARWNKEKDACKSNAPIPNPIPTKIDDGDEAREPLISSEAMDLADELAREVGHDPKFVPPAWCGAAGRIEMWFAEGWTRQIILETVRAVMARKRDGPPGSVQYFEKALAKAHAVNRKPLPQVVIDNTQETVNVRPQADRSTVAAAHRLVERLREWDTPAECGEGGGNVAGLLPAGRRG
jgi:uncharacterized protein YdaU (DUF1376 family)